MKRGVIVAMLAGVLAVTGCVDTTTVVELNADGSGRIVETAYMSAAALGMMGGMMAGMGGEGGAQATVTDNPMMDEGKAKAKVSELGEGVKFESIKEISKPDGSKGAQIIYAFGDISKLKVSMGNGDSEMGGGGDMGDEGVDKPVDAAEDVKGIITFEFAKGNLTVNMPKPKEATAGEGEVAQPEDAQSDAMGAQMMQGMLPMFKGMRMRMFLKMPSEITETNAKYAGLDASTKKKQIVTLLDMNMDAILAQPDGTKNLMKLQKSKDQSKNLELLSGIEGIKVETAEKISIKF